MFDKLLIASAFLGLCFVACSPKSSDKATNDSWKGKLSQVDKLVYRFQDGSVPPPSHRSFTITATPSSIGKVVDSYGDVVSEQRNPITAQQFRSLLDQLDALGIGAGADKVTEPDCSGGTGESVKLYVGDAAIFSASASYCGAQRSGSLLGDAKALAKAAEALLAPPSDDSRPKTERFSREQIEKMLGRLKVCVDKDSSLEAMSRCGCASDLELSKLPPPADPDAHCAAHAKAAVEMAARPADEQAKAEFARAASDVPPPGSLGLFSFAVPCLMKAIEAKSESRFQQCVCATHDLANQVAAKDPKSNAEAEKAMGEAVRQLKDSGACPAPE